MQKQVGIWLDKRQADLFFHEEGEIIYKKIQSNISENKIGGGSRSSTPYGPMINTSESKLLNKKNAQATDYFQKIFNDILSVHEVLLFGPSTTKIAFLNFLEKKHFLEKTKVTVKVSDSISLNQKKAKVLSFFMTNQTTD